ncbi:MAG: hypothetical protein ACTH7L_01805 [Psychrobacter alimentarius]
MSNLITRAIRKQIAIDALARLNAGIASQIPKRFMMTGRSSGKTTLFDLWVWRVSAERAYLENIINS